MVLANQAKKVPCKRIFCGAMLLVAATTLTACNKKEGGGQSLARVNGEDITMLQVNQELAHANVPPGQKKAAVKKIVESLINRQVVVDEAKKEKIDRSPAVLREIARAKAQIIEQAYLRKIMAKIPKPSEAEISDYFHKHPEIFGKGKLYDMHSLLFSRKYMDAALKSKIDSAKSLGDIELWLSSHNIHFARGIASRTTMQMPPAMAARLETMHAGQMFIVNEGGNSMVVVIDDIKNNPVAFEDAAPAIERYLQNKKAKEVVDTEMKHLRSLAKIEYLKTPAPGTSKGKTAVQTPAASGVAGSATSESRPAAQESGPAGGS